MATGCRHCGRPIEMRELGWASPDADNSDDDPYNCEADHETREADHEPAGVMARSKVEGEHHAYVTRYRTIDQWHWDVRRSSNVVREDIVAWGDVREDIVAWGDEYSQRAALEAAFEAVTGARLWRRYGRTKTP